MAPVDNNVIRCQALDSHNGQVERDRQLNRMFAEGWRLVAVVAVGPTAVRHDFYFERERPKPKEAEPVVDRTSPTLKGESLRDLTVAKPCEPSECVEVCKWNTCRHPLAKIRAQRVRKPSETLSAFGVIADHYGMKRKSDPPQIPDQGPDQCCNREACCYPVCECHHW